ncbi:MAG: hypothetical protein U1E23_14095 [Reyranellaceae bacterium]
MTRLVPRLAAGVALLLAGCHDVATLEESRAQTVRVDGRLFEVRVTRSDTPDEFRMLITRATMVVNPDPQREAARAQEVAALVMDRTCRGRPSTELFSGLDGPVSYRVGFRCG